MGSTFNQTLGYNEFDNLTSRNNKTYGFHDNFSTSYSRNRASNSDYDAAGNVVNNVSFASSSVQEGGRPYTDTKTWRFDAAGRMVHWDEVGPWDHLAPPLRTQFADITYDAMGGREESNHSKSGVNKH